MSMQHGSMMSVMKYENVRDYVISVATQKAAMSTPKPMEVDQVSCTGARSWEHILLEPRWKEKEDRRPAPQMWMRLKEEEKGKVRHATLVDCQGISQGSVLNLREEDTEAKEARVVREVIKVKARKKVKEEERGTREVAGIAVRRVTSHQNA